MKQGGQSNWETDLEGVGSELAFCKLSNVYPDMETSSMNPHDCHSRVGAAIDVKSTKYAGGRLLAVRWKDVSKVDLFALMVGKFPEYRLAGFMRAADLVKAERLLDLGYGPVHCADQSELIRPEKLIF